MPPVHSYIDGNIITDDVDTCSPVSPQQIRFHRQDATETEDTVTQWRGVRRLQPKRVTVGSFDYKQPPLDKRTTLDTQDDQGNLPETELYDYAGEYYYREFERGERLVDNRLEAHESRAKRFYGAGGIRHLSTGAWFELTQHSRHDTGGGEEREFLILGLSIHAENSLPMTAQLKPMPGSLQTEIQAAKEAHGLTQEDPAGITLSTPESLHFAQTHDFSATTGQDMNFSQGKNWVAAAREKLSLFVEKAGIKLFAGKQKVEIQAQSDNLELTSKQDNTTTSTESNIDLAAAEEVLLVSGGAYVRIKGGNIELHAPGKVEFFGAMKSFTGPTQQADELPPLPDTENTQLKLHHTYGNDEPVALAQYQAILPDGSTRTGQLDRQGKATLDGVPPGCAFVDYHTQPDPINPDGSCFPKDKEGPPDISMLAQPTPSQPEEEEETLSTAEQLKQKAGQYNQRATDLREQLNNNPNGKSHEEALALQDEVTRLNADTQQLQEDLNEAARAGELTGSDLTDALYDVDDAANRANNLRPEAARQVQYASPNGQNAREVAELVVPGFGTLTDAKDIAQLLSTGQYGAATGETALAIASIFPPFRAARKVGRTSDAAEDVASAAKAPRSNDSVSSVGQNEATNHSGVGGSVANTRVLTKAERLEIQQTLQTRVDDIRAELPKKLRGSGNMGVAQLDIPGLPTELKAHSRINYPTDKGADGFVHLADESDWIFKPKAVDPDNVRVGTPDAYTRQWDTEFKILNDVALRLGNNRNATGSINLFTERLTCTSCTDVIFDFKDRYPNIQLNVFAGE